MRSRPPSRGHRHLRAAPSADSRDHASHHSRAAGERVESPLTNPVRTRRVVSLNGERPAHETDWRHDMLAPPSTASRAGVSPRTSGGRDPFELCARETRSELSPLAVVTPYDAVVPSGVRGGHQGGARHDPSPGGYGGSWRALSHRPRTATTTRLAVVAVAPAVAASSNRPHLGVVAGTSDLCPPLQPRHPIRPWWVVTGSNGPVVSQGSMACTTTTWRAAGLVFEPRHGRTACCMWWPCR